MQPRSLRPTAAAAAVGAAALISLHIFYGCCRFHSGCCRCYFSNKSHTLCMQLFFALTKGNSARKSMQRKVVVVVVEKSHLHYAAPEIVISR